MSLSRPATRIAAVLAAGLLLTGGVIGSALPAGAVAAPAAHPQHRQSVWLPTGDVVSFDAAHPKDLRVATRVASGPGHAWRSVQHDGHVYVFPLSASPFLGTVLDPSLFDVTALAAGSATVHVTGAKASVPGLTVTSSTGASQTGRFTHAGAKAFGAALQKAAVTASRSATAVRTLFGASAIGTSAGGGGISPQFQQQTVIFKAVGPDGKPVPDGLLFYGNLDDSARATDFAFIVDGEVRVSLPAGHYTLYSEDDTFTDTSFDARVVTSPNLVVTGATNQVVPIDFRTATARPSVTLPRPTTPQDFAVSYDREWEDAGFSGVFFGDASGTIELAPAPKPQIGTASLSSFFTAVGAKASEYDTFFVRSGAIPADLSNRVAASQLAAVRERIFDNGSSAATYFGHGVTSADGSGIGEFRLVTLPLDRTDYLLAPAGSTWNDGILLESTSDDPFGGELDDGSRTYTGGSSTTTDWLRQAIAPQIPRFTPVDLATGVYCPACRVNGELTVAVLPFQDTATTGHFGFLYDESTGSLFARTRLYRKGTLLDDEPGSNFVDATVPAARATYKVVADSTPSSAGFMLGSAATSTWTFSSAAGSGGALPADWSCSLDGSGCRILPLLQVRAPLPTDLSGNIGVGAHTFDLTVSPIQGAPATTTTAKVQVSFDGGKTWTTQPAVAHGANCFRVTLTNPGSAVGTTPSLRITGTDAAGGSVVQTVTAAYRVSAR